MIGRRSFLTLLGIAPIGAPALANEALNMPAYSPPTPFGLSAGMATPQAPSGPSSREILKRAYKLGLISEHEAKVAAEWEFGPHSESDETVNSYKSFSASAKARMHRDIRREKALARVLSDGDPTSFWAVVERVRDKVT